MNYDLELVDSAADNDLDVLTSLIQDDVCLWLFAFSQSLNSFTYCRIDKLTAILQRAVEMMGGFSRGQFPARRYARNLRNVHIARNATLMQSTQRTHGATHATQPTQLPKNGQRKHLEKFSKLHASNASADQSESCDCGQRVQYPRCVRCMQCNKCVEMLRCVCCVGCVKFYASSLRCVRYLCYVWLETA